MSRKWVFNFIVTTWNNSLFSKLKMENSKITFQAKVFTEDSIYSFKIICTKCGGSGNFKTSENSRRTCLECFGKGYLNC